MSASARLIVPTLCDVLSSFRLPFCVVLQSHDNSTHLELDGARVDRLLIGSPTDDVVSTCTCSLYIKTMLGELNSSYLLVHIKEDVA